MESAKVCHPDDGRDPAPDGPETGHSVPAESTPEGLSISLIIPAFNEESYIGKCLQAVSEHIQARACEVIVVDNGSTDRTAEIVAAYPNVTCLFEPEKGVTKARQCGFRQSRGEILAFIDADTIPPPGWIEQIEEQFRKDAGLACMSGPYFHYDLSAVPRWITSAWFVAARLLYHVVGYLVVGGNFAIRRSVLEAMGGFDASIEFYGDDADTARRAHRFGRVFFSARLVMPTSGRRLQSDGYLRMAALYLVNFLSVAIRGRPVTKGYTDVR
jgi:glycosyltransferase involved in cell wall biosynthesis